MKKIFAIFTILLISINSYSQSYITAMGGRFGTDLGITIQQRLFKHFTAEGIFQTSLHREELMLTVLGEHHFPVVTKRLNIYTGLGYHQSFLTSNDLSFVPAKGISAIAGAEITIARFTLSYDFKPAFNYSGGENNWYIQSGISLRYVLITQHLLKKHRKQKKRKQKKKMRQERRENFF